MKPFVPFDEFERECVPENKPLAQTMQENCNERLAPPEPECRTPCLPNWVATGEQRCTDTSSVVEIEEADGCGRTRWVKIPTNIVWTDTDTTECDEVNNRIKRQQVNQCGGTRWITTGTLCCTPDWVNKSPAEYNCDQAILRTRQEDGCGNERWYNTSEAVTWLPTGESECQPGDIYVIEEINQCGVTRNRVVDGGCPCIPDWSATGTQRCTGSFIEIQEQDGCGHTRWTTTDDAVAWTNTGETRCSGGFVQNEQINQCGTTRWFTTGTACTTSPEPNEIGSLWSGSTHSGNGTKFITMRLDATTGMIYYQTSGKDEESVPWVTGGYNRAHYEARISYTADEPADSLRTRSGTALDTWFNLGDISVMSNTHTCTQPDYPMPDATIVEWRNLTIRFDIRKVGEPITGGVTFGPLLLRAN